MSEYPLPLSVLGVTKGHATKAVKWLRNRSVLAFYRPDDKSLNAWVLKTGPEDTYRVMNEALAATRH